MLFNLQGTEPFTLFLLSAANFYILAQSSSFVNMFFTNFQILFCAVCCAPGVCPSSRQLDYDSTLFPLCQAHFFKILNFFLQSLGFHFITSNITFTPSLYLNPSLSSVALFPESRVNIPVDVLSFL